MKLKEIHRTSTFAWSPASAVPVLATGTVSGALDESFSNDSRLEIWSPNFIDRDDYDLGGEGHPQANHSITTTSRWALCRQMVVASFTSSIQIQSTRVGSS